MITMKEKQKLTAERQEQLLKILKERFIKNMDRHPSISWEQVQAKLEKYPEKLWSLNQMEETGGEPDVYGYDENTSEYIFIDFAAESPEGRRNCCYDEEARMKRKKNPPETSALGMAAWMGVEILTEEQYRKLQELGEFDTRTSSWIKTPEEIRKLGGALFCDRRYNTVFVYHNGADSYYSSRGFRACLRV